LVDRDDLTLLAPKTSSGEHGLEVALRFDSSLLSNERRDLSREDRLPLLGGLPLDVGFAAHRRLQLLDVRVAPLVHRDHLALLAAEQNQAEPDEAPEAGRDDGQEELKSGTRPASAHQYSVVVA